MKTIYNIIKKNIIIIVPEKFKYLFKKNIIPLGRWSTKDNDHTKSVKATLANYDSCGDNLCGDPMSLKKTINEIKKS